MNTGKAGGEIVKFVGLIVIFLVHLIVLTIFSPFIIIIMALNATESQSKFGETGGYWV